MEALITHTLLIKFIKSQIFYDSIAAYQLVNAEVLQLFTVYCQLPCNFDKDWGLLIIIEIMG